VKGMGEIPFDINFPMMGIMITPINVGGRSDNPVSKE
jgi:hypothetical protein